MRFEACAVYILANLNRSVLYVGVTSDLLKRIPEHRERLNPRSFTSRYRVDRLVHFEPFQDIVAAIEREKQLKSWTRAKKLALIEKGNREWRDLWPEVVPDARRRIPSPDATGAPRNDGRGFLVARHGRSSSE